jgi:hypothetical protein
METVLSRIFQGKCVDGGRQNCNVVRVATGNLLSWFRSFSLFDAMDLLQLMLVKTKDVPL